jgi:hypothetical protein
MGACADDDGYKLENDEYNLTDIRFYLAKGDGIIDTVRFQLDTTTVINTSYTSALNQPAWYPYKDIMDSISLQITQQSPTFDKVLNLNEKIKMPSLIDAGNIFYPQENNLTAETLPALLLNKNESSGTNFSDALPPRTMEKRTGTYHRIIQQASFEATYQGEKTGQVVKIMGKWRASKVTTQSINSSEGINITLCDLK